MSEKPKWDCADGTPDEDHDWKWISDWYGDPGVINGTADCSYWECRVCGKVDENREPPSTDDDWEDYRDER